MKMKVTKSEKILLIILGILIFVYAYYSFVINAQSKKIQALETKKSEYEDKINMMNIAIASEKSKALKVKTLNYKIKETTQNYFPQFDQEKIIIIFDDLLKNAELKGKVLNFSTIKDFTESSKEDESESKDNNTSVGDLIDQYKEMTKTDEDKENDESNGNDNSTDEEVQNKNIQLMQVTVSYSGTFDNLMKFIGEVENFDKRIVINNISITPTQSDVVNGSMLLYLYAIPQFESSEYYKWDVDVPFGKNNPFKGSVEPIKSNSSSSKEVKYDFYVSLRPTSSDLPAIIIGKANDINKDTYIYGDKNDIDNGEMYFSKDNGKYYFKYKTSEQKYPSDYKEVEFKPLGDSINIKVYSKLRNSDNDKSGINLKIINKTDLSINIYPEGDDENRPRLNIIKDGVVNVK